ncbi:MAG: DNA alkylation repair protein [Gammaproteobacteria bacterium]|nr:DNA alkylation repair protein [Gammaproteobacteria bacterium]
MKYPELHAEVLKELAAIGSPSFALHTPKDRKSELEYSGVRVPERRKLSRKGFSFFDHPESEVISIWDDLFMHSPNGDVLFCALDYLRFRVPKSVSPDLWSVIRNWVKRVENWAHSDEMSWVYSYVLEAYFDEVFEDLVMWNKTNELWPKRISIVSLIHYTGKNAVFLPPDVVFPMVERCVDDDRYYMQKATGWVLREMHRGYPNEVEDFLSTHLARIGNSALTRAVERMEKCEREAWRDQKKRLIQS